jgi:hypothetical protein
MGAVLCCTEHTEMNIWQQDVDETLQGHNLVTKMADYSGICTKLHARQLTIVIHVTQSLASRCRIVAA